MLSNKLINHIKRISVYKICTRFEVMYMKPTGNFSKAVPFINEWLAGTGGICGFYCIRYCG